MREQLIRRGKVLKSVRAAAILCLLISWNGFSEEVETGPCAQMKGKTIRWIVPNAPGGGNDTYSRLIEPFYERRLDAEIVIENMRGAGGIIAANKLKAADPDGLTMGILSSSGLLMASLSGVERMPNPAKDYTILGRIARNYQVWVTSSKSTLRTIEDVLKKSEKRPIIFGTRNVESVSFGNIVIASYLLGIDYEVVAGYRGSRAGTLAAMRGEVDVVAYSFESILDRIEAGELRVLMQVTEQPISSHASLQGVPVLGGDNGIAVQRAVELGRDIEEVKKDAKVLADLIGAGRIIVAPLGLDEGLLQCLEQKIHQVLDDPDFKKAAASANRSLHVVRSKTVHEELNAVSERLNRFLPIFQKAIKKVRE